MPIPRTPRHWWPRLSSADASAPDAGGIEDAADGPDAADLGTGFGLDDSLADGTTDHGWLCPSLPQAGRVL